MNVHELPMIIFTIFAQMSVGAFVVLGIIQVVARFKGGTSAVDKITDPLLYAIGPAMVFGLIASMFHMNDITNTLNVLRHWDSSWLSREIILGASFAGLGFLFALAQWFKWGSTLLRQILAGVTAVVGLALVYAMSMIYYTLVTVPAWNTFATPAQFFTTTFLLGCLAVGAALMSTIMWRIRKTTSTKSQVSEADAESQVVDASTRVLMTTVLKGVGIASVVLLSAQFIIIALHLSNLAGGGAIEAQSAVVFSGGWFIARLLLVFLGAGLLALFVYRYAASGAPARHLAIFATSAFVLVLAGEIIGRSQFYDSMFRIGM
ncbi:DmsC/YnfH family molybdoenzyme membrane anchor subunit [Jonesiaceae bacterium BS-20]|uniref:DmsC/YnfH family molybdoenzyme membrane anchor subunit n=1 Tax=Jonesiaceae bacterium BS-20 TaxID=3120821 RepID=A0AAU7DXH8_9MICO